MKPNDSTGFSERPEATPPATVPPIRLRLEDLLRGQSEAVIVHEGEEYRLCLTKRNRLILRK